MSRAVCLALATMSSVFALAQTRITELRFAPWWGEHALELGATQHMADGSSVRIDRLRFYVGTPVVAGDSEAMLLPYTYHLVDASDSSTWRIACPRAIDHILMGVDSLTNVSGVLGGDLDPTKGMYWAWNSGYINVKVEGTCSSSPYPKQEFELHLGGYLPPNATVQQIDLKGRGVGVVEVKVDVRAFLAQVDLASRCNVMSPGAEAVRLSRAAATMFVFHAKH
ncbi:MAG TPA: hypothetical protein PK760_11390 [Flavobacteriales bacterium]|nr:hypothetical protein [Flavobacteriales bacterium]